LDLPDPPEGWEMTSACKREADQWSVFFVSATSYCLGEGTTLRYAMLNALAKIEEDSTYDRLSGMKQGTVDLIAELGIKPKPLDRRF
jgi:hypothetical protein